VLKRHILALCAAAVVACEPFGVLDPAALDDPGQGEMPEADPAPPAAEPPPPCGPVRPWRRPGGGGGPAGHDADWQLTPRLPEGWNRDGSVDNINRTDACGRTVRVEVWEGCIDMDNCTSHGTWSAEYDASGNLIAENRGWETFIRMNRGGITIDHGYDERGARIWTQALDMNEEPAEAVLQWRHFQNDAQGRVVREEVTNYPDYFEENGELVRISTFVYTNDTTGAVTESVDEGADGVVDAVIQY
jgi:hypothetical protein